MIEIQEVRVKLDSGEDIECYLEDHQGAFGGECIFPPASPAQWKSLIRSVSAFPTSQECYEWIIDTVARYAGKRGAAIVEIDNPCNAPFINKADQQAVLSAKTIAAPVLVNGA